MSETPNRPANQNPATRSRQSSSTGKNIFVGCAILLICVGGGAILGAIVGVKSESEPILGFFGAFGGAFRGAFGGFQTGVLIMIIIVIYKQIVSRSDLNSSSSVSVDSGTSNDHNLSANEPVQVPLDPVEKPDQVAKDFGKAFLGCSVGVIGAVIGAALGAVGALNTYDIFFLDAASSEEGAWVFNLALGIFDLIGLIVYTLIGIGIGAAIGFGIASLLSAYFISYHGGNKKS